MILYGVLERTGQKETVAYCRILLRHSLEETKKKKYENIRTANPLTEPIWKCRLTALPHVESSSVRISSTNCSWFLFIWFNLHCCYDIFGGDLEFWDDIWKKKN